VSNVPSIRRRSSNARTRVTHAAAPTDLNRAWRVVDIDDVVAVLPQLEGDAAAACADVEYARPRM
jgi:hypothetical protein